MKKILVENFFGRNFFFLVEYFFVAKSFPRKQDEKHFGRNIFWSKIILLQNHFLGISLELNKLDKKFFVETFLVENFFVTKSFPWKQDEKMLVEKFFGHIFFYSKIFVAKSFPRKQFG